MLRVVGSIIGMIGVGAACGIMNGVPQRVEPGIEVEDHGELDAIRAELDSEQVAIRGMEAGLHASFRALKAGEARIAALRREINATVRAYPGGIPSELYPAYCQSRANRLGLIERHARESEEYSALYGEYEDRVARYNKLLSEASALARRAGFAWYTSAIPRIGGEKLAGARG